MVQGNQAGPSKSAQREPPDRLRSCRNETQLEKIRVWLEWIDWKLQIHVVKTRTHGTEGNHTTVCKWWHQLPKHPPWGHICQWRRQHGVQHMQQSSLYPFILVLRWPNTGLPWLSNDLWSYVGGCATHSVQGPVNDSGQTKVAQLQRLTAIMVFIYLRNTHHVRNYETKDLKPFSFGFVLYMHLLIHLFIYLFTYLYIIWLIYSD